MSENRADIVRLTKAAGEAAQRGQWDEVVRCYSERGLLLAATPAASLPTEELLRMDDEVRGLVHITQAVLEDLLGKAQMTKRQVQGIRQGLGVLPSQPEAMSVEA